MVEKSTFAYRELSAARQRVRSLQSIRARILQAREAWSEQRINDYFARRDTYWREIVDTINSQEVQ